MTIFFKIFIGIYLLLMSFTNEVTLTQECKPIYVRWPRVRLNVPPTTEGTFPFTTCKGACTNEENPVRKGSFQECSSFNHRVGPNQYSSHCQLFQKDQSQILDGYIEADDRYSFYWKYCLKSNRVCSGDYAFNFLSDRYMARSEIQKYIISNTLEDCLSECLNQNDYICRSVTFNRTSGGCSLSSQNQLSKPAMIKLNNNPNFRVDYYENNCFNISESFNFDYKCEENGIRVTVNSKLPYTGALYGLYDFFTCKIEPKEETNFEYLFEYPTISKNCSDSIRFKGKEMILEVVLSTDGVEPLYFITPDDLTFQARCPILESVGTESNEDGVASPDSITAHISFPNSNTIAVKTGIPHQTSVVKNEKITVSIGTTKEPITTTPPTTKLISPTTKNIPTTTTTQQPITTQTPKKISNIPEAIEEEVTLTTSSFKPTETIKTTTTITTTATTTTTTTTTTKKVTTEAAKEIATTKSTSIANVKSSNETSTRKPQETTEKNVDIEDVIKGGSKKDPVTFEIFHNGQPVEVVVVGSRITLSFTPYYAISPAYMSITGCQVEPIGSLYDWEKEPLAIIKDGCQADHVGLVCPPQNTDYGVRVTVEAFRYQTTAQIQYTCLIRICPFAECPINICNSVDGCPNSSSHDILSSMFQNRAKRYLSLEEIRAALAANPYLQQQLNLANDTLPMSTDRMNAVLQQQLVAIGGDHVVRRRLIVVNSEEELKYYVKTGDVPDNFVGK